MADKKKFYGYTLDGALSWFEKEGDRDACIGEDDEGGIKSETMMTQEVFDALPEFEGY